MEPTLQHGIRPSKQLSNVPTTVPEEELDEIDLHDQKTMPQLMQRGFYDPLIVLIFSLTIKSKKRTFKSRT